MRLRRRGLLTEAVRAEAMHHALPTDLEVLLRWWHVPAGGVPADPEAQIVWLYDWWHEIDHWIAANQPT